MTALAKLVARHGVPADAGDSSASARSAPASCSASSPWQVDQAGRRRDARGPSTPRPTALIEQYRRQAACAGSASSIERALARARRLALSADRRARRAARRQCQPIAAGVLDRSRASARRAIRALDGVAHAARARARLRAAQRLPPAGRPRSRRPRAHRRGDGARAGDFAGVVRRARRRSARCSSRAACCGASTR